MNDMVHQLSFSIHEVAPYINWVYFYHAWALSSTATEERMRLRRDAEELMQRLDTRYHTHTLFAVMPAVSDGDDIIVDGTRMPMLRQQYAEEGQPCLSLADYIRPASQGQTDHIGLFAATVDYEMEHPVGDDDYQHMLHQTVADRLAEATVERMHQLVRTDYWGYAPHEQLTIEELHAERFQGIRPAVGYPSLPDTSMNFVIDSLLHLHDIGITLTEHGAMRPHASVSGLMIAHPQARYFNISQIGDDQLHSYALRRGVPEPLMRRFLQSVLVN